MIGKVELGMKLREFKDLEILEVKDVKPNNLTDPINPIFEVSFSNVLGRIF